MAGGDAMPASEVLEKFRAWQAEKHAEQEFPLRLADVQKALTEITEGLPSPAAAQQAAAKAAERARRKALKEAQREPRAWKEALKAIGTVQELNGTPNAAIITGWMSYAAKGGRLGFQAWKGEILAKRAQW